MYWRVQHEPTNMQITRIAFICLINFMYVIYFVEIISTWDVDSWYELGNCKIVKFIE